MMWRDADAVLKKIGKMFQPAFEGNHVTAADMFTSTRAAKGTGEGDKLGDRQTGSEWRLCL